MCSERGGGNMWSKGCIEHSVNREGTVYTGIGTICAVKGGKGDQCV